MPTSPELVPRPTSRPPRRGRIHAMTSSSRLEELEAAARYHLEGLDLYRAKVYGSRPTTVVRLRKLERACEHAEGSLRRAQREPPQ
jgi:hypothetical protein